ncbi:MAG: hypothetical protein ACFE75_00245 [Candidatus Hodarchaeota archaeon]
MVNETKIIIRNRNDKDKSIKDAIFAFSGGRKTLLIKGEGEEISTAVEVAEILKNRMYPRIEIGNVSLGSRPYLYNKQRSYYNRNNKSHKKKIDIISNIEITLQTKSTT